MKKYRRGYCDRSSTTPSTNHSRRPDDCRKPVDDSVSDEAIREWEEVKCPICLEPPHNAVLLQCSSYVNGCRPYVCNTSRRHSNCLDQFCNSVMSCPSLVTLEPLNGAAATSPQVVVVGTSLPDLRGQLCDLTGLQPDTNMPSRPLETAFLPTRPVCPLCRGQIHGWFVVRKARELMDSKSRSCSYEACDFKGNYMELRQHARCTHPFARPAEVDPVRAQEFSLLEDETVGNDRRLSVHIEIDGLTIQLLCIRDLDDEGNASMQVGSPHLDILGDPITVSQIVDSLLGPDSLLINLLANLLDASES